MCLVRAPSPVEARGRLVRALQTWTKAGESLLESGRLAAVRGDVLLPDCGLADATCASLRERIQSLVHAAGDTRFTANSAGDPDRTNVAGTRNVLECAARLGCRDWHHISTAYAAGAVREAREELSTTAPTFRNAYERSKWEAEQLAVAQARENGAALTIYRPSVVVGHSATGMTSHFAGIYYMFRAVSLLARAASDRPAVDRHALPLRIPAAPDKRPNLICIDDVAAAIADLFDAPAARGGVYHLTHPEPPTNARVKHALESYYDVGGGRFTEGINDTEQRLPSDFAAAELFQRMFDELTTSLRDYLFDAPDFSRARVDRFVRRPPADWTDERLRKLIVAAEQGGWRSSGYERQAAAAPEAIGVYFREFLPARLHDSKIGRVERLDATVRFEIGAYAHGRWWCRFGGGGAVEVAAADDQPADVIYRTSESRFWAAVAGEISAAELFLTGAAEVDGDVEKALKFAMLLEEFVREHPYQRIATNTTSSDCIADPCGERRGD